jgi:hypothetical protein
MRSSIAHRLALSELSEFTTALRLLADFLSREIIQVEAQC